MYSISSAETFALAIRVLPHATIVGDFTSGCFADTEREQLPNGWDLYFSKNLIIDHNGFCWEGIGVPPDIRIANSRQDDENDKDRVLELAIELMNSGTLKAFDKEITCPIK
jgi:C-terminal processing protease CtpA/Prc